MATRMGYKLEIIKIKPDVFPENETVCTSNRDVLSVTSEENRIHVDTPPETLQVNMMETASLVDKSSIIPSAEPAKISELPDGPWRCLSMDFCGPFPSGDYLFAIMDDYSRFPVVEVIRKSAETVIPKLDQILAEYSTPREIRSDNGPPFNSGAFRDYANSMGFHHRKITPEQPRANGEIERFMASLKKAVQTAHVENRNWKDELFQVLRTYRAATHCSTGKSPYAVLFGRPMNTKLPDMVEDDPVPDENVRFKNKRSKDKMKEGDKSKSYVREHEFKIGDRVFVRQRKKNKLTPSYEKDTYEVIDVNGSMNTGQNSQSVHIADNDCSFDVLPTDDVDVEPEVLIPPRITRDRRPPERYSDYVLD